MVSKAEGARHRTPALLMCRLPRLMLIRFPDRAFVFAGDSGFGTHEVTRFCQPLLAAFLPHFTQPTYTRFVVLTATASYHPTPRQPARRSTVMRTAGTPPIR